MHPIRLCLLALTLFPTATLELVIQHRGSSHLQNPAVQGKSNVVNSREKAEDILQRYGYLKCTAFKKRKHLARFKQHSMNGMKVRHPFKHCATPELREAIRLYQKHYNIPQTGRLDHATMKLMSASRCGNPDMEVPLISDTDNNLNPIHHPKKGKKRPKRSLKEILHNSKYSINKEVQEKLVGNTLSRRRGWIKNYEDRLKSGEIDKRLERLHHKIQRSRKKRSFIMSESEYAFNKEITWRLITDAYSKQLTIYSQRLALALAFRMWSEVIPPMFYEDAKSPVNEVDILIAFGKGEHRNCPNDFDGYGGQLSHAIRETNGAEIHVDDDEHFTMGSEHGTNLLKVAVHEVGHILGLIHVPQNYSIMYAIYSEIIPNNNFELRREDRKLVQSLYGRCSGRFDTVFDWVRRKPDGELIYNTYFFRNDHFWMYENRYNRTRYGDPLQIFPEWKGIPDHIDGFVQIWSHTQHLTLFFKGPHYWTYDSTRDEANPSYPRNITDDFRKIPGTKYPNIPNSIDTVFFDNRDSNLYFFKDNLVYGYNASKGHEGCCLPGYPKHIHKEFPSAPENKPLPRNLDAVYYSYTDKNLYFLKGRQFWVNSAFSPLDRRRTNLIHGPFFINDKWRDICDVEFT